MKKTLLTIVLLTAISAVSWSQTKWKLDASHSNVNFTVMHLMISEVQGSFKVFDGSVEHSKDDFSDAKIAFTVDVNSINTENQKRDEHLKGDDFFNSEKFPKMSFVSTSMKKTGDKKYDLSGKLTIRDITKDVVFQVNYLGQATVWGTTKAGFTAKSKINRFDYNLKWNSMTEAGGAIVGPEVNIELKLEFDMVK